MGCHNHCNGFAIRVSGLGDTWFEGPHADVQAKLFDGHTKDEITWMGGESTITETIGLGGFAQACAFTLQQYQGGSAEEMVRRNSELYEITIGENTFHLPILESTEGPNVIDIRKLYSETGHFTFDPGFTSTASCESSITFIDGIEGQLLYRGYSIEELAKKSSFLEVSYLLLYGNLPNQAELDDFTGRITRHTMLHEQMTNFFRGFRRDAHPMAIICGVQGAMSSFYHDSVDISDSWQREVASVRMIAKLPTIVAWAYKYSQGQPFIYPQNSLDYSSNFLRMCFAVPTEAVSYTHLTLPTKA